MFLDISIGEEIDSFELLRSVIPRDPRPPAPKPSNTPKLILRSITYFEIYLSLPTPTFLLLILNPYKKVGSCRLKYCLLKRYGVLCFIVQGLLGFMV